MEKRGEKIAGSRYRRAFCFHCGEPVRASKDWAICDKCNTRGDREAARPRHIVEIMRRIASEE